MSELIIKDHDFTLFKTDITGKQAAEIMNSYKLKDKTIQPDEEKEVASYQAGTNPGD